MGDLRTDARRGYDAAVERIGRLEREVRSLRSTARLLRRGQFAPGSIPTSALQQPSAPASLAATASGAAIELAGGVLLTQDVTVPARMTKAAVLARARVYAINGSASAGALLARVEVDDFQGNQLPVGAAIGNGALNPTDFSTQLTGLLTGQIISVRVWAQTSNEDWPADASNLVELTGQVSWWA